MNEHIDGIRIKYDRAVFHLDALNDEILKFLNLHPFQVIGFDEGASGDYVYNVIIYHEVPKEIAPILGDLIHNLRSVLDYLIWQAVLVNGEIPSKKNKFPIFRNRKDFLKFGKKALSGTNQKTKLLVGLLSPYQGGNDLLWKLHNLDIVDKHRLLLGVGSAHTQLKFQMKMDAPNSDDPILFPKIGLVPSDIHFPLKSGDEVFRIKAVARKGKKSFETQEFTFNVVFGDGEYVKGEPILKTMNDITEHVERIINFFEKYIFR